jgi:hypothetical protein
MAGKSANIGEIFGRIMHAANIVQAKSIAEAARGNIFLYKVGMSQSVGDVKVAVAINKYIETMCGVFTLIVSGINPIANKNDDIKGIIKSISAEGIDPRRISIENAALIDRINTQSTPYDFCISETPHSPRAGRYARSEEKSAASPGGYQNTSADYLRDRKKELGEKLKDLYRRAERNNKQVDKSEVDKIEEEIK